MNTPTNDGGKAGAEKPKTTGLIDRLGSPILVGNIVHWSDGGDDLSLADRIAKRWDRIAEVGMRRILPYFKVIDSPYEKTKKEGHTFCYGTFIYQDTENYLTVVASNAEEYHRRFKNAGECMAWVLEAQKQ